MLGHGLVEGRIKDPNLRDLRQDLRDSLDTEDVRRIVQRSQLGTFVEHADDLGGDTYTLSEALSAVYQSMPNSVDLIEGGYEAFLLEDVEDDLYTTGMIGDVVVALYLLTSEVAEGDEGVIDAYTLFVA